MLLQVLSNCIVLFLVTLTINVSRTTCETCLINVKKDLHDLVPLLLDADTLDFAYPEKNDTNLRLQQGQKLRVFCPGKKNRLTVPFPILKHDSIICDKGNFSFPGTELRFPIKSLKCLKRPQPYVKVNFTNSSANLTKCVNNLYAIGFNVGNNKFLNVLEACFDRKAQSPVISFAEIVPMLKGSQRRPKSSMRFNSALVDSRLNTAYKLNEQQKTFERIFGANATRKYITDLIFLERGHLMARADFYYQSQQSSSYYYLNAVPMWSVINGGNWAALENAVRKLSINNRTILRVWTGSFGVLELKDDHMKVQPVYLLKDSLVPVPKYLFKLIYEESTKRAVVILAVNNPFLKKLSEEDVICNDVISEIKWLRWNKVNATKGLMFACSYDEFKRAYDVLPELNVKSLLTK